MKTKTLKIMMTALMVIFTLANLGQVVLANNLVPDVNPDYSHVDAGGLTTIANRIVGLIQLASGIFTVVLIAVFGFKFIMGSANEKADYQKSFIPLIVGVFVVFAATTIGKLIFSTFTNLEA